MKSPLSIAKQCPDRTKRVTLSEPIMRYVGLRILASLREVGSCDVGSGQLISTVVVSIAPATAAALEIKNSKNGASPKIVVIRSSVLGLSKCTKTSSHRICGGAAFDSLLSLAATLSALPRGNCAVVFDGAQRNRRSSFCWPLRVTRLSYNFPDNRHAAIAAAYDFSEAKLIIDIGVATAQHFAISLLAFPRRAELCSTART